MITEQAFNTLKANPRTARVHLVALELPSSTAINPAYLYYTDYSRDITYNGKVYRSTSITGLGTIKHTRALTTHKTSLKFTGLDKQQLETALVDDASFINKKIITHLVLLDLETETPIPLAAQEDGMILLEGQITNVSVDDSRSSTRGTLQISWEVANHFHNFNEVNGRITDNNSHRGVVVSAGEFVSSGATKRPEYMDDLGFEHANKSVDVVAQYEVKEKRYKLNSSRKGGFGGLMGGRNYSLVEYEVIVNREVDIRFDLSAKFLPVIYGVQQTTGVPVFADTIKDDPSNVYVVYTFCEGEIEGFLDLTIDDKPIICIDDQDDNERVCFGRKRVVGNTISVATPNPTNTTAPSTHGQEYIYDDGAGEIRFWTYHGKSEQAASSELVALSKAKQFYLQNMLGKGTDYWSANHKLLDTAYIVMKFKLSALDGGRTNIPEIKAEILGRKIPVYSNEGPPNATKTSIIPAWQILDYMRSRIFGGKVPLDEIDLQSFIEVAADQSIIDTNYESSWVPFWRYLGWTSPTNANRQILQTNPLIATEEPIFKNLESMLAESRCALNKINGKYTLSLEKEQANPVSISLDEEAIGDVKYRDLTGSKKFNTVMASIRDPALGWRNNSITMYNSVYKTEDLGVEKRLTLNFPSITNYYTARNLADRELKKSRFSGELSITLPFYYIYKIIPNTNVLISYELYGWDNALFLVDSLDIQSNGNILVVLHRYSPNVFINSEQADNSTNQRPEITDLVLPPRNLIYTPADSTSAIGVNGTLTWLPSLSGNIAFYSVNYSGNVDPFVVEARDNTSSLSFEVKDLPEGNYTFSVRAVDTSGTYSKAVTIVVDVDPAINLPVVSGFRVVNLEPGHTTRFIGPDVILEWDPLDTVDYPVGAYTTNIQVLYDGTVLKDLSIAGTNTYKYTLAQNKTDYATLNSGALGFHRDLSFRAKYVTAKGGSSVNWSEIT